MIAEYITNLSIKNRVYAGFMLVCSFILILSLFTYQFIKEFSSAFADYEAINTKSSVINVINEKVDELQFSLQIYISTGYDSFAVQIDKDIDALLKYIDENRVRFMDDSFSIEHLAEMREHIGSYKKTFNFAKEELKTRNAYIEQFNTMYGELISNKNETPETILTLTRAQSVLYEYLNDADIEQVNLKLDKLSQYIEKGLTVQQDKVREFRSLFVKLVQANRGFLFLVSVVMAGESAEFQYVANELQEYIAAQVEPLKQAAEQELNEAITYSVLISILLVLTALITAYLITNSISEPLSNLKETFYRLSQGEQVDQVSEMHLNDEIGQMSRAADVFRLKNEETRLLVTELEKKTNELEQSNYELEQFAYIASHDLQEPLRTITSFVSLLEEEHGKKLDGDATTYLEFITSASDRMKKLIHGLLEYSRIGKSKQQEEIKLEELVKEVTDDMRYSIDQSNARIQIGALPEVTGFKTELRQLFQNLVSNAIKFRHPDRNPEIEIGTAVICGQDCLFVQDNGIGIDQKFKDKIFFIFQRLHTQEEYEGSGIGLAHCKKIIELHKGHIWFNSEPGKGSTFYFTLP